MAGAERDRVCGRCQSGGRRRLITQSEFGNAVLLGSQSLADHDRVKRRHFESVENRRQVAVFGTGYITVGGIKGERLGVEHEQPLDGQPEVDHRLDHLFG